MKTFTTLEEAQAAGAETIIKDSETEYRCYMPGEIERPVLPEPIPSITPWQIRKALSAVGLRDQVEAAVAASSLEVKDGWQVATVFERHAPLIVEMAAALKLSSKEVDDLFKLGATL